MSPDDTLERLRSHHHVWPPTATEVDLALTRATMLPYVVGLLLLILVGCVLQLAYKDEANSTMFDIATVLSIWLVGVVLYRAWTEHQRAKEIRLQIFRHITKQPEATNGATPLYPLAKWNAITSMDVRDGTGRDRLAVVITVEWPGIPGSVNPTYKYTPTLFLFRDTGDMQMDVNAVARNRASAKRLNFAQLNQPIHHVDAEVTAGKTYNYYAWVEVEIQGMHILVSFEKRAHVVRSAETKRDFVERKISDHELMKRWKEVTAPPPEPVKVEPPPPEPEPVEVELTDFVISRVNRHLDNTNMYRDAKASLIADLSRQALPPEDEERLLALGLRELDVEYERRVKIKNGK